MVTTWAVLMARTGSKRLPGKIMRSLAGKPLADYTLEAMLASNSLTKRWVFTDDQALLTRAREFGLDLPNFERPAAISEADSSSFETLRYFLKQFNREALPERLVLLQATSPLRTADDIEQALEQFDTDSCDYLVSVHAPLKPFSWTFEKASNGRLSRCHQPDNELVFPNGALSIFKPELILDDSDNNLFDREDLVIKGYEMPWEASVDIDYLIDFQLAELLIQQREAAEQNEPHTLELRVISQEKQEIQLVKPQGAQPC